MTLDYDIAWYIEFDIYDESVGIRQTDSQLVENSKKKLEWLPIKIPKRSLWRFKSISLVLGKIVGTTLEKMRNK